MSDPITSVTEGRVTITANDTADNIRESAGFNDLPEMEDVPGAREADTPVAERNPDGTFKPKVAAEPEPEKPNKSGDPRKSFQARIDVAVAKQREAERRAEDAERRVAEREAEWQAKQASPTPQPVAAPTQPSTPTYLQLVQRYQSHPDAPKFEDFVAANVDDPYGMHRDAMAAFITDRRQEEHAAQQSAAAQQRERESSLQSSFQLAAEAHPDFQSLLAADTRVYPPAVQEHLRVEASLDPALSAELFHHLLTHPDDAARLATMTHPIAAAREIGRLTAHLSSAPSGPETVPVTTTAKPLIKPVRSSVATPEPPSSDTLPFSRYVAVENERERKARAAR